jgi:hypothetical protein
VVEAAVAAAAAAAGVEAVAAARVVPAIRLVLAAMSAPAVNPRAASRRGAPPGKAVAETVRWLKVVSGRGAGCGRDTRVAITVPAVSAPA